MSDLITAVKELLKEGKIDLFIGYEKGTRTPRPLFVSDPADADKLIFDEQCTGNLAVYLTRKDLVAGKKVGISASYYALKSICQLFAENQLKEELLVVFGYVQDKLKRFENLEEIRQHLANTAAPIRQADEELIKRIEEMSMEDRWEFWTSELSKCFKCYACRSACPMCYCTKCIVEVNRPQWIQPWAATGSNMEWQINRVMHMAGRCSDCGSCGSACPLGLPVHILTHKMSELVKEHFGEQTGKGNVLSTFKPEDKENFIL
ncbi:4Fe-4S dicluster domain-containing protein [Bacteroidales bacterium OttesenSCG-928-A17]|nr:4Fe-4S dicluster domain-containing protein [Bacteroidales bacterium OttesenSCG-928-A17]